MTKHNHLHFLPTMVLMLMALMTSASSYADEVTVVADRWYPYNGTPNAPDPGYMVELVRYGLAKGGHKVRYQLMSWERALNQVREGKKNCVLGATRGEAEGFVLPSEHQGVSQNSLYRRKGEDWHYTGRESLDGIRLGTIAGYEYDDFLHEIIDKQIVEQQIKPARGKFAVEENLKALIRGDLDAVLDSRVVVEATLKKQNWQDDIEFADHFDGVRKIYFACSPSVEKSSEYVKLVNDGIKDLRASGELDSIMEKYGLADWVSIPAVDAID